MRGCFVADICHGRMSLTHTTGKPGQAGWTQVQLIPTEISSRNHDESSIIKRLLWEQKQQAVFATATRLLFLSRSSAWQRNKKRKRIRFFYQYISRFFFVDYSFISDFQIFPIYLPEKRVLQVEIVLIEHLYYLCSTRINNFYCVYL